jgi:hypothetical protein
MTLCTSTIIYFIARLICIIREKRTETVSNDQLNNFYASLHTASEGTLSEQKRLFWRMHSNSSIYNNSGKALHLYSGGARFESQISQPSNSEEVNNKKF